MAQLVKNLPPMWEAWVRSLGGEGPLEEGKAPHSSILAWRIPWTVESMGSQRVGRDCVIFTSISTDVKILSTASGRQQALNKRLISLLF